MILDGKKTAEKKFQILKKKVSKLKKKPVLVIIQVGNNKESNIYIKKKIEFGKSLGVGVENYQLKSSVSFDFIKKLIGDFNNDTDIKGIIVQLPLPQKLDKQKILDLIDHKKDVDGLTSNTKFLGATPRGIFTLLKEYKILIKNKVAAVIGDSDLVGKPVAKEFARLGAKVVVCNIKTKNIKKETIKADILVSAVGKPNLIKKDMVKKGAVVIDVGTTFVKGKLNGDVDFDVVSKIAKAITPVPGGVGPMTVVSLFENLLENK
jgi:methylenetetrahydrofolate dehydrogenase (NADP+) / methenyltetrahydrofolate cyclohydrolase